MNWETGIDIHAILCTKITTNENLLYSTGNSIWCFGVTQMGRKSKKEGICVNIWLIYSVVQQKLTEQCKASKLQFKKKFTTTLWTQRGQTDFKEKTVKDSNSNR